MTDQESGLPLPGVPEPAGDVRNFRVTIGDLIIGDALTLSREIGQHGDSVVWENQGPGGPCKLSEIELRAIATVATCAAEQLARERNDAEALAFGTVRYQGVIDSVLAAIPALFAASQAVSGAAPSDPTGV
jgi:hypothetical protein